MADRSEGSPFGTNEGRRTGSQALKSLEHRYYKQRNTLPEDKRRHLPPFINVNAYRAAWLVERLEAKIRLDKLLLEAGLTSAATLDRYLSFLTPDETVS
jgi:hypothetical protein